MAKNKTFNTFLRAGVGPVVQAHLGQQTQPIYSVLPQVPHWLSTMGVTCFLTHCLGVLLSPIVPFKNTRLRPFLVPLPPPGSLRRCLRGSHHEAGPSPQFLALTSPSLLPTFCLSWGNSATVSIKSRPCWRGITSMAHFLHLMKPYAYEHLNPGHASAPPLNVRPLEGRSLVGMGGIC